MKINELRQNDRINYLIYWIDKIYSFCCYFWFIIQNSDIFLNFQWETQQTPSIKISSMIGFKLIDFNPLNPIESFGPKRKIKMYKWRNTVSTSAPKNNSNKNKEYISWDKITHNSSHLSISLTKPKNNFVPPTIKVIFHSKSGKLFI